MCTGGKTRLGWVDSIRFLAFLIVFTRHYIESFFPEYTPEKVGGLVAFLAHGLTGKGAVAMFFVLSGYFVAASVEKYHTSTYIVHRYLYLACHLLIANFIAAIFVILFTIIYPLEQSVFRWSNFNATFLWEYFFSDSLFFYIQARSHILVYVFDFCILDFCVFDTKNKYQSLRQ